MRAYGGLALTLALMACANQPKMLWLRTDGKSGATDPVLAQQFQIDKTVCVGQREKADLSGVTVTQGGLVGAIAVANRANAADAVAQGCMAEKGYILVREDEAPAKQQELLAVATEKARREAAANSPPPTAQQAAYKPKPKAKPQQVAQPNQVQQN
jgi:hypothetical protein